jgi:hypothetical protein
MRMSVINTCQLCGVNSLGYLTELQRHVREATIDSPDFALTRSPLGPGNIFIAHVRPN